MTGCRGPFCVCAAGAVARRSFHPGNSNYLNFQRRLFKLSHTKYALLLCVSLVTARSETPAPLRSAAGSPWLSQDRITSQVGHYFQINELLIFDQEYIHLKPFKINK